LRFKNFPARNNTLNLGLYYTYNNLNYSRSGCAKCDGDELVRILIGPGNEPDQLHARYRLSKYLLVGYSRENILGQWVGLLVHPMNLRCGMISVTKLQGEIQGGLQERYFVSQKNIEFSFV